jgi:hypothetical protein
MPVHLIKIVDQNNEPVSVTDGALDISWQDQHTPIVDLYLHKHLGNMTLASNTSIGDTTLSLAVSHDVSSGECICLKESDRFYQGQATSVFSVNNISLDTPLDYAYTTAATASRTNKNMNVDGSGTTQIFHVKPPVGVSWDITRIMFYIQDGTAMDTSTFGGIAALANGIVLRKKDGTYKNIFNAKSNGDITARCDESEYDVDRAPADKFGFRAQRRFGGVGNNGVTIRLNDSDGDELEVLVQDNLTGLEIFNVIAQGHKVE